MLMPSRHDADSAASAGEELAFLLWLDTGDWLFYEPVTAPYFNMIGIISVFRIASVWISSCHDKNIKQS